MGQQPMRVRPKSAGASLGSALRVGTTPEDIDRSLRHRDMRFSGNHGFKENIHTYEEHLGLRSRVKREDFDERLKALERHHRLPTPSLQQSRYSLGEETGLPQ